MDGFAVLDTEDKVKRQINLLEVKIRRKEKRMSQNQKEQFEVAIEGKSVTDFISRIQSLPPTEEKKLSENRKKTQYFPYFGRK